MGVSTFIFCMGSQKCIFVWGSQNAFLYKRKIQFCIEAGGKIFVTFLVFNENLGVFSTLCGSGDPLLAFT